MQKKADAAMKSDAKKVDADAKKGRKEAKAKNLTRFLSLKQNNLHASFDLYVAAH